MLHKVTCVVCGNTARIKIDEKTGKIRTNEWRYWGRIHNPKRDKYFVEWLPDGKFGKHVPNPDYDPKAPRFLGEYWEDAKCFNDPKRMQD